MALPTLWQTTKKELLRLNNLLFIIIVASLYYSVSVLLVNYRLLTITLLGSSSYSYKLNIFYSLIIGSYFALGILDFSLTVITSLLVSANLLILIKTLRGLKSGGGKLTLTVGGSTILGILVAGSCACGFSILSVLGLTGAFSLLPFGGLEVHLFIILLLSFSLWYSIRTYHKEIVCKIK